MNHKRDIAEEAPTNAVGGGNIAGVGVGDNGEPGGKKRRIGKIRRREDIDKLIAMSKQIRGTK